jgi:spore maturation protein CgeB
MLSVILFGKAKRRTRTTYHIARAFRESGCRLLWLNPAKIRRRHKDRTDQWILDQIGSFRPDMVFIYSRDIPSSVLEVISAGGIKTVMYYEDMSDDLPPELIHRGRLVDFFLATNKGLLEKYKTAGIANPFYFTGACDRYDHRIRHPVLPLWKSDIAFIGMARPNESRVILTRKLSERHTVKVYGKSWQEFGLKATLKTVTPRGYCLVCNGAKIVLGADFTSEVEGYWSNRLWLTLGGGGFFLTRYVRGMENFFENRKHLVWYHDEQECLDLAGEYLSMPQERRKIALAGYHLVHRHHTYHHFVERVIALIG